MAVRRESKNRMEHLRRGSPLRHGERCLEPTMVFSTHRAGCSFPVARAWVVCRSLWRGRAPDATSAFSRPGFAIGLAFAASRLQRLHREVRGSRTRVTSRRKRAARVARFDSFQIARDARIQHGGDRIAHAPGVVALPGRGQHRGGLRAAAVASWVDSFARERALSAPATRSRLSRYCLQRRRRGGPVPGRGRLLPLLDALSSVEARGRERLDQLTDRGRELRACGGDLVPSTLQSLRDSGSDCGAADLVACARPAGRHRVSRAARAIR